MTISFEKSIKEYGKKNGADLIGIAPAERFKQAPKGFKPSDILPGAQSVIVMGMAFPKGALTCHSKPSITKTYHTIFDLLDACAYTLSCFIEQAGYDTVPVPADQPYFSWDEASQQGKGDLSHKHAAVLAGLGSLGKNSLLLTPEYGNRVNLVSVVTSAPLEGDSPLTESLCLEKCNLCIKSCPAQAIQENGTVIQRDCRKFHHMKTPRRFHLFSCWKCRAVCPVKGTKADKVGE